MKQEVVRCKATSVWATRAASSANQRSWISCSRVFLWSFNCSRLNRPLSRPYLMQTPSLSRSFVVCKYIQPLVLNHTEEFEENQCQNTTLLYTIGDREGHWEISVVSNLAMLILVQLDGHVPREGCLVNQGAAEWCCHLQVNIRWPISWPTCMQDWDCDFQCHLPPVVLRTSPITTGLGNDW